MPKLYVGEVDVPREMTDSLAAAGFTLVNERAPIRTEDGDLTVIAADPGITSSLRHEVNRGFPTPSSSA